MAIVYIGIGSNIGDRYSNCKEAMDKLNKRGCQIKKASSFIETSPWGIKNQPIFINLAVEAETTLSENNLLLTIKNIEGELGREVSEQKWQPRTIDLDILFYNDEIVDTTKLIIPHPLLHKRDFVLLPLLEIAPHKIHPVLKKTIKQIWEDMKRDFSSNVIALL